MVPAKEKAEGRAGGDRLAGRPPGGVGKGRLWLMSGGRMGKGITTESKRERGGSPVWGKEVCGGVFQKT